MYTKLNQKIFFIILCSFGINASDLPLVAPSKDKLLTSIGMLEVLPQELLPKICWEIFATKPPQSSKGQKILSLSAQKAQSMLDIDIYSLVNFIHVSKKMKDVVCEVKKNYNTNLPLLLTRRNNLFAHEYWAKQATLFFKGNLFSDIIKKHTDYYASLYNLVKNLPENESLVIPQELRESRGKLIPSYRCAAANKLCRHIHKKQDDATKKALLEICELDSYSIMPNTIWFLLEVGKDLDFLSNLVTKNPNIVFDSLCSEGYKLLHVAGIQNNLPAIKILSAYAINIQNNYGTTPLIWAVMTNNVKMVKALLDNNANPNIQDSQNDTALIHAVRKNNLEIAKNLLTCNADPNIQNRFGNTALIRAAYEKQLEMVQLLMSSNADPDIADNNDNTALTWAMAENNLEKIVEALRGKRAAD